LAFAEYFSYGLPFFAISKEILKKDESNARQERVQLLKHNSAQVLLYTASFKIPNINTRMRDISRPKRFMGNRIQVNASYCKYSVQRLPIDIFKQLACIIYVRIMLLIFRDS